MKELLLTVDRYPSMVCDGNRKTVNG